jgi:hypothetical protein
LFQFAAALVKPSADGVKLVTLRLCTEAIFNEAILQDFSVFKGLQRENYSLFLFYLFKHCFFNRFGKYADAVSAVNFYREWNRLYVWQQ